MSTFNVKLKYKCVRKRKQMLHKLKRCFWSTHSVLFFSGTLYTEGIQKT